MSANVGVDWDEYSSRSCTACASPDVIIDMSCGDVVCRDCGLCLRSRILVDDSELRLDGAPADGASARTGGGGKRAQETTNMSDRCRHSGLCTHAG